MELMLKRGLEDIEEGMEYDIEVIRHSDRTLDLIFGNCSISSK